MQHAARAAGIAWRVDEHGLAGGTVQYAENPVARGVRLGRDNAELFADERIQQRRFADVGPPEQRNMPAPESVIRPHA